MTPPHAPNPAIALLVDGENLSKDRAAAVLTLARGFGDPQVRRVYGNAAAIAGWEDHGFRLCPTRPGKNAADMLLCVEAMALALRGGFSTLLIASSDRDFSYLAEHLREAGKRVVGIGEAKAPPCFRAACTSFVQIGTEAAIKPAPPSLLPPTKVIPLIRDRLAQSNRPGNWGTVTWIGHCLRQAHPTFNPADYGKSSYEDFLRALNYFEFGLSAQGEPQIRDPHSKVAKGAAATPVPSPHDAP